MKSKNKFKSFGVCSFQQNQNGYQEVFVQDGDPRALGANGEIY